MPRIFQTEKKVALYSRGNSTKDQTTAMTDWVYQNAAGANVAVFDDSFEHRLEWERLASIIDSDGIQIVVCASLDRLDMIGDDIKEVVLFLSWLESKQIRFVSVKDGIDTKTSSPQFITLVEAVARAKTLLKSERVRASLHQAKTEGRLLGRRGGLHDADIRVLRAKGISIRKIAEMLGIATSTVQEALRRAKTSSQDKDLV